ncbi:MAG: 50S ribosomal protein L6 [Gammaproteobacteria bacterium]|nr:50S ribosomal protein L6 [Gammaproteobacteria bacterium]
MSRVAKNPITVPAGVEVNIASGTISVKGAKGVLTHNIAEAVEISKQDSILMFSMREGYVNASALAGTTRAVVNNMVKGVSRGFEKKLQLVGVGYRAQAQGKVLNLTLGFSHPVNFTVPEGITIETPSQTEIVVKGVNKQQVGQIAANIRSIRPPEPYKGKGVRYTDEHIVRKEAKKK